MADRPIHELKTLVPYFEAMKRGEKNFEVRRDDRGFQRGDIVLLQRYGESWVNKKMEYLDARDFGVHRSEAETLRRRITYVLTGGQFGIEPGYVVLGLEPAALTGGA